MRVEETIQGCIKNDIRSKELVYKSFYGYLKAVLLRYVYNDADVDELVNDCFMKIFNNLISFNPGKNNDETIKIFKGWIAKIACHTAIDYLRRNKQNLYIEKIEDKEAEYIPQYISTELETGDILALLNKLPKMHRTVFNMYEIEGYNHEEIAEQLQISQSTSRVFLSRAKNKLKNLYLDNQLTMVKDER